MSQPGERLEILESTQAELKLRLQNNPSLPDHYFISADQQTQGRGRSDHVWNSVSGNLHVSILLKDLSLNDITWTPLWISVCVHRALVTLGVDQEKIQLKWPNDLWTDHSKKIGGILCEKVGNHIIAGIGLNLLRAPHPNAGVVPSMNALDVENVLEKILIGLKSAKNPSEIKKYYELFEFFSPGDVVTWTRENGSVAEEATVIGLGSSGELLVKIEEKILPLFSEEISLLRTKNISSK